METRGAKLEGEKGRMTEANANHKQKKAKLEGERTRIGVKQGVPEKHTTRKAEPGADDNGRREEENARMSASEHGKGQSPIQFKCLGDVEKMIEILNANVKSEVAYSDFRISENDLGKDLIRVGRFSVPSRLAPIARKIAERHGDIASLSSQSDCAANPSYILLCAAIKEMDDFKLEQINEAKMLLWRDAINSALNLRFRVGFAMDQLNRIGRAYFGLKAIRGEDGTVGKMEVPADCSREANYFFGKPLSTGLFH